MNKTKKSSGKDFSLSSELTKAEKSKRTKYLSKRISDLYCTLSEWITGTENYSLKKTSVNVDGEKLPGADILSGKKIICSLKPAGLFAFGFNCRVDIISGKIITTLVDIAKENSTSDWQLISSDAGKRPKKLTKMVFRNLLKKMK